MLDKVNDLRMNTKKNYVVEYEYIFYQQTKRIEQHANAWHPSSLFQISWIK